MRRGWLCSLMMVFATLATGLQTADQHGGSIHAASPANAVVDVMRDALSGLSPIILSPVNGLNATLDYMVTSLLTAKRLHRASVPEMDVPQVVRLFEVMAIPAATVLSTLTGVRALLEELVGPVLAPGQAPDNNSSESFEPLTAYYLRTGLPRAFPVLRRAFMAWVMRQYLAGHQWSIEESEILLRVARYFHRLHRVAAEAKHVLEFFHISKAGGSSLCQLGVANGCTTQNSSMRANCMIKEFRDFPRWTRASALPSLPRTPWCARFGMKRGEVSCSTRRTMLSKMRWNFFANEYVMQTPGASGDKNSFRQARPCTEFLYVMVFRDPEARMLSHLQNVMREYTWTPPPPPPPYAPAVALFISANQSTSLSLDGVGVQSASVLPIDATVQPADAGGAAVVPAPDVPPASGTASQPAVQPGVQAEQAVQQADHVASAAVQPVAVQAGQAVQPGLQAQLVALSAAYQSRSAAAGAAVAVPAVPATGADGAVLTDQLPVQQQAGSVLPAVVPEGSTAIQNGDTAVPTGVGAVRLLLQAFKGIIGQDGSASSGAQATRSSNQAAAAAQSPPRPAATWEGAMSNVFFNAFDPLNAAAWQKLAPAVVDNYFLRSLLGEHAYISPLHSLTPAHLLVGKLVTLQLDVLLTLELSALNAPSFEMGLGWSSGFEDVHARHGEVMRTEFQGPDSLTLRSAMASLRGDNAMDRELYEFAAVAQMLDAVVWGLAKAGMPTEVLQQLDGRRKLHQCGFVGKAGRRRRALRMQRAAARVARNRP